MIVKLQRPIAPPDGPVLIYDEYRRFTKQVSMTRTLQRLFGTKLKIYCEAEKNGDDVVIGRVVPDRAW